MKLYLATYSTDEEDQPDVAMVDLERSDVELLLRRIETLQELRKAHADLDEMMFWTYVVLSFYTVSDWEEAGDEEVDDEEYTLFTEKGWARNFSGAVLKEVRTDLHQLGISQYGACWYANAKNWRTQYHTHTLSKEDLRGLLEEMAECKD